MIYMNNAATSYPKPPCVTEAVAKALSQPPGDSSRSGIQSQDVFETLRAELAFWLGVNSSQQIALGPNATWGLNLGIFGLGVTAGDTVVSTKGEHNSVLRPLYRLSQHGIRVILLDTDATGRVDSLVWANAMERYRPKLAVFTHASNVTGAVNDAEALTAAAKNTGAVVLMDAAQTLGCIPVQAEAWGLDMVAFTGHKYLLGPQGTGGLWVRPGLTLTPYLLGGTGILSDRDTMPVAMPMHIEAGTGNEPSAYGLLAALQWQRKHPLDLSALEAKTQYLSHGLAQMGAAVIAPAGIRTPVVSFTLPEIPADEIGYLLHEGGDIICRTGLHCAPKIFSCLNVTQTVRLSLSRFTTDQEVKAVLQTVEGILP